MHVAHLEHEAERRTWWAWHNYGSTAAAAQQRWRRRRARKSTTRSTSNVALSRLHYQIPPSGFHTVELRVVFLLCKKGQVCHKEKKNCNMQVVHRYLKRQLRQPATKHQLWRPTKLNKTWKAHQQSRKRYRPAEKIWKACDRATKLWKARQQVRKRYRQARSPPAGTEALSTSNSVMEVLVYSMPLCCCTILLLVLQPGLSI